MFDVTPELIRSLSRASRIGWLVVKEEARELRGLPREKFRCPFLAMLGAKEWGTDYLLLPSLSLGGLT